MRLPIHQPTQHDGDEELDVADDDDVVVPLTRTQSRS
jgi:hypothetical protein